MKNKEKNFISAVAYIHNAESKIDRFLKMLIAVLEENFEHSEIICVNDSSDDSSVAHIKEMAKKTTCTTISVVNMSYFHGLEMSMNAGVDLAIGDFVFEFDSAELDFDSSEILKVYRKALEGFDIVSASPDRKQKLTSRVFYRVLNRYTDFSYKMYTERFRILSRRVINRISSMNKYVPYRKAIYANCGLKMANLMYDVISADTNLSAGDKVEKRYRSRLAIDTLILFTDVGYRFSITMTVFMMLIAIFMIGYSVVIYLTSNPVTGWTTTILFLSAAFFGLFGILTIIIKYLQILVDLVFKHRRYSFESIEKLTR